MDETLKFRASLPGHGGFPGRGPWATLGAATNRPGRAAGVGEGALPGVPQGDPQRDGALGPGLGMGDGKMVRW